MPTDITIVIADAARTTAMRSSLTLAGRVLWFPANKLSSALDSIQLNHPKLVIVDAQVSETPQGKALLERVEKLAIRDSSVRLIVPRSGGWTTMPLDDPSRAANAQRASDASPVGAVPPSQIAVVPATLTSTRRAPRFQVGDPLKVVVEGADAMLMDISMIGAQVMSGPILRPNQKVTIALPDSDQTVRLNAEIAWSTLQQTRQRPDAHYRAGMEFTEAAGKALEEFCRRFRP
jgi:hypothetical protein